MKRWLLPLMLVLLGAGTVPLDVPTKGDTMQMVIRGANAFLAYDLTRGVTKERDGSVSVVALVVFADANEAGMPAASGRIALKCLEQQGRILTNYELNQKGEIVRALSADGAFAPILEDTPLAALYSMVCGHPWSRPIGT